MVIVEIWDPLLFNKAMSLPYWRNCLLSPVFLTLKLMSSVARGTNRCFSRPHPPPWICLQVLMDGMSFSWCSHLCAYRLLARLTVSNWDWGLKAGLYILKDLPSTHPCSFHIQAVVYRKDSRQNLGDEKPGVVAAPVSLCVDLDLLL